MKTKFNGILTLLLAFTVQFAFAQKTVSGTVSDETGPLPGVSVLIKGSTSGTETDFDGKYSIQANTGDILQYSFIGMPTKEKTVGASSVIDVLMSGGEILEEVVITAQGIKKEKKALGYAVSSIKEDEIKDKAQGDLTRVLSGKAAGVDITSQSGMSGSSNKVIIRGMTSFQGENNALYVVDGVPISNATNEAGDFEEGNMGTSRSFDIDPNNIENVEILKGLAAATLYGSAGRNGVILITTKTGSHKDKTSKQEVAVSSSYFFNQVASLPDYQDKYGGGFDQDFGWFYSNWGPGFHENGLGGWANVSAIDDDGTVPHPYSTSGFLDAYPDYKASFAGQRYDWKPRYSVEEFFRTGGVTNNSVNLSGKTDNGKLNYGLNYSQLNEDGFTPNNSVSRHNFSIGGNAKLSNKISFNTSLNFARTNMITPPVASSGGSSGVTPTIFGDLFYTPRSVDFFELPYQLPDGGSIYYRDDNAIAHPLWTLNNAEFSQKVNRVFGNANITYGLSDNLNLVYRASLDTYSENNINYQNRGGVTGDNVLDSGYYRTWNNTNSIWDHTLIFSGNGYSFKEKFNLGFDIGATANSSDFVREGLKSDGQQVFGFLNHKGFTNREEMEKHEKRNILGAFGQINFDYDNMFFLNLSGRNDWVSNMYNKSLFYPSVSASFIPTKAFSGIKSDKGLNFLKLRAGWGTSANFPTGYPTATATIDIDTQGWLVDGSPVVTNTSNYFSPNPNLRPELVGELEFGVEAKMFKRVNLDFSYYTRNTTDLLVDQPLPPSSGFRETKTNIGKVIGDGYEVDLNIDLLKNDEGVNWNSGVTFSKMSSEVIDLGQDTELIIYSGYTNLGNGAREGYPLTSMFGSRIARTDDGQYLINASGGFVGESLDEEGLLPYIGDSNPDFVMNYNNSISYKNFSLNFSINHTSGGDMYSQTISALLGRGLTTDTEDRLGTFVLPGISQVTGEANTVQINNSDYYFTNMFNANGYQEVNIYDASVVRLKEVSIGYSFSKKFIDKTPFGKISLKASGYNMWYNAYNTPKGINFDPNVAGLGAGLGSGFEYLNGPSGKRYGLSVNLTF